MKLMMPGLESERLLFRGIKATDFNDWLPFFKDPQTSQFWIMEQLPAIEACEKWYERQADKTRNGLGGMNVLIEKSTGSLIGHCGLSIQDVDGLQEIEIGYSLLPQYWGRGYASEAARYCRDFAFNQDMTDSLISIISCTNEPSKKVAIANGMQVEKTTSWSNNSVEIYRINRSSWKELENKYKS